MRVEMLVARVLFWGGLTAVTLMVVGVVMFAIHTAAGGEALNVQRVLENRAEGRSTAVFVSVGDVVRGLAHRPFDPLAVAALGVVVLLLTPVGGVVVAIVSFWMAGDRRYMVIASVVLAGLILSFVLGGAG